MVKPFVALCGMPGGGKSVEAFKTFQNSFAILTAENNAHYYRKLLTTKLANNPKYRPPKKIALLDTHTFGITPTEYSWLKPGDAKPNLDANGQMWPWPQKEKFEWLLATVKNKCMKDVVEGRAPTYDAVVIDEFGELLDRIFVQDIQPNCVSEKSGKVDGRAAFGEMGKWADSIVIELRQLISFGVAICLVMHDREPDGDKRGGLKAPSAAIGTSIAAKCDGVIQRIIKDPELGEKGPDGKPAKPKRLWSCLASEKWTRKLRGLDPEDEEVIGPLELYEILTRYAGFELDGI
jgi:hypothetical protein